MFKYLLSLLLFVSAAHAQNFNVIRNDDAATVIQSNNLGNSKIATDDNGVVYVRAITSGGLASGIFPLSPNVGYNGGSQSIIGYGTNTTDAIEAASTTTVLNLTAHVAQIGDMIRYRTAGANLGAFSPVCAVATNSVTLCYPLPVTPTTTDSVSIIKARPIGASGTPTPNADGFALNTAITIDTQGGTNNSYLLKAEDVLHASGDAGVMALAVRNTSGTAFAGADGDYSAFAVNQFGSVIAGPNLINMGATDVQFGVLKAEDSAATTGDALVAIAAVQKNLITNNANNGDYTTLVTDTGSRLVTTSAPGDEMFSSCSGTITDTTISPIKPAVALNRIYVTSIGCSNTSAVQSRIIFRDGATAVHVGAIPAAASGGNYFASFAGIPIRGSVNTAFQFDMATTSTATQCCIQGYISVT